MSPTRRAATGALQGILVALVAGCGGGGAEEAPPSAAARPAAVLGASPEPPAPALRPAGARVDRLRTQELRPGKGARASRGSTVLIRYVAGDARTAREVESTYEQGAPLGVRLGAGLLAPGLERGVAGMREGGRRRIEVPRRLARGHRALVYVVDLVKVL